jgi:voltage-gated potassium channel
MALASLPVHSDVVVNCAGLGSRLLADDLGVHPVRGQVLRVEQVGLDRVWLAEGPVYVVPRSNDVVVGGTADEGAWDRRPDPAVAQRILARPARWSRAGGGRGPRHRVGLRPARERVRLEVEHRAAGAPVVHCYGHGGAGVTLSWVVPTRWRASSPARPTQPRVVPCVAARQAARAGADARACARHARVLALGLLAMIVAIVYFDREGYNDSQHPDRELTPVDTVYYATVTLTTTGYGDIVPVDSAGAAVQRRLITPLRIMFLILLVGTTLEVLASQGREQLRITRWRRHMRDHVIVVGYGTKGRSAVQTLISHGVAKDDIVIIDPSSAASSDAQADGLACIVGDATRRDILARAEVHKAQQIVVTADRDDAAVLVTLMARQSNGHAYIVVAVREEQNVDLVRQSGADATVTSSEAVGRLLGLSTVSPGSATSRRHAHLRRGVSRWPSATCCRARPASRPSTSRTRSSASSGAGTCTATSTRRSPRWSWGQAHRRALRPSTCRGRRVRAQEPRERAEPSGEL